MNAPGLTQASDPTAGAWQAGNIAELNRLLAANKPTLEQLLASYGLSQADIDHLRGQGVKLPAPAPTAPRPTTPAPAPAAGGDPIAAAWQSGNISGLNALLSAPGAPTLAQLTSQYNLAPADIAHLRGQGVRLAAGGITSLGAYSDGGRMVKGPGDGVSDDVPAVIGGAQPAALANDEFVVPARVVAELGNGSSEAGAKKLYAMMDRVEAAARKAKRGQDSKAERFLPA
jgi:hypothetical protein